MVMLEVYLPRSEVTLQPMWVTSQIVNRCCFMLKIMLGQKQISKAHPRLVVLLAERLRENPVWTRTFQAGELHKKTQRLERFFSPKRKELLGARIRCGGGEMLHFHVKMCSATALKCFSLSHTCLYLILGTVISES